MAEFCVLTMEIKLYLLKKKYRVRHSKLVTQIIFIILETVTKINYNTNKNSTQEKSLSTEK
jgi:hypothetical protein